MGYWKQEEIEWFVQNYHIAGLTACMEKLGRSQASILQKASKLGLRRKGAGRLPRAVIDQGYIFITHDNVKVALHRLVMENKLGRALTADEIVHHKDENKFNCDPDNLEVTNRKEHQNDFHPKSRDKQGKFISGV